MNYLKSHTKLCVGELVTFLYVERITVFHQLLKAICDSPSRKQAPWLDCTTEKEVPWGHGSQAFLRREPVFPSDFPIFPSRDGWDFTVRDLKKHITTKEL